MCLSSVAVMSQPVMAARQTVGKTPDSNFTSAPLFKRKYLIEYTNTSAFSSFFHSWRNRRVAQPHKARYIIAGFTRFYRETKANFRLLPSSYIIFVRYLCCEFVVPLLDVSGNTARGATLHFVLCQMNGKLTNCYSRMVQDAMLPYHETIITHVLAKRTKGCWLALRSSFHCWSALRFIVWLGRLEVFVWPARVGGWRWSDRHKRACVSSPFSYLTRSLANATRAPACLLINAHVHGKYVRILA